MARGLLDYFPDALSEVARVSQVANEQHNPGEDMYWARGKSMDHADCLLRHLADRGTIDTDGQRHTAKIAWRALALLQEELEAAGAPLPRGARVVVPKKECGCNVSNEVCDNCCGKGVRLDVVSKTWPEFCDLCKGPCRA
jgi:hypothetical protein